MERSHAASSITDGTIIRARGPAARPQLAQISVFYPCAPIVGVDDVVHVVRTTSLADLCTGGNEAEYPFAVRNMTLVLSCTVIVPLHTL